ncbi:Antibiotic biosynthesis monooxygenase [Sphingobium faniae]|nr:Antibiotic biosynthesis monooxygenase [Sphingobium faniae]
MVFMVSRRRLEDGDFDAWKVRFEGQMDIRAEAGCRGIRRFRGVEDPQELMMIFEWDSIENARAFVNMKVAQNPKLVEQRQDGGGGAKLENIFMEEMDPLPS